ncbi:acid phosphatase, putative [Plasmodium chabaudi chabaudi]|uniref:diphosphoinositol-pentakisphosphate 1-kinase n=1 Tax=Plasmodium chabaudi chabaudi TaxID=31271 RepID=A0A4V0K367_PLACU|nr:acid phosphatase, putative [Plasmodium chabaudi chabaudi]VTZ66488.1 acid phosphatase, putative [Plasmodium chabaudi chabaudi]|eukprot:XP_016655554.1 acid phosphatase, putative [Plasmodium chabaudi chabaudi]
MSPRKHGGSLDEDKLFENVSKDDCEIIKKFTLGVCAMESKVESAPMECILKRLAKSGDFNIIKFKEDVILNQDIDCWPIVDCLIAFYSYGFPLKKAIEYVKKYNPITLNNLEKQLILRSRLQVYEELKKWKVPHANYVVVDHDTVKRGEHVFEEYYDYIVYDNIRLNKPFIEKPINADNHNNWIYYPKNTGGGCKKLFRKIKDRSSEYCPDIHQVRTNGTYIYEEFLSTFGTDIKVYTVGQMFAHAEARKSPALDGKVCRTSEGKEVRYAVILSEAEKIIAYRIVEAFQQTVCGFDILRTANGPFVCDVNGWSFVKGNIKYYNDCAHILRAMFLAKLEEKYNIIPRDLADNWYSIENEEEVLRQTFRQPDDLHWSHHEELCSVIIVMRHGDRKPKQKMKFITDKTLFLEYFNNDDSLYNLIDNKITHDGSTGLSTTGSGVASNSVGTTMHLNTSSAVYNYDMLNKNGSNGAGLNNISLEKKNPCNDVEKQDESTKKQNTNSSNSNEHNSTPKKNNSQDDEERKRNLQKMYTKKQIKFKSPEELQDLFLRNNIILNEIEKEYKHLKEEILHIHNNYNEQPEKDPKNLDQMKDDNDLAELEAKRSEYEVMIENHKTLYKILERGDGFTGINRKIQLKPVDFEVINDKIIVTKILLVAKWGGELTRMGRRQSENLGKRFRATLYPGDSDGLLRLHSTFRHDFKIFTSDEGRCQITSAAFTKGFLDLDGELTPILVAMVIRNSKAHSLLDDNSPSIERTNCKTYIDNVLNEDKNIEDELLKKLTCGKYSRRFRESLKKISNFYKLMEKIRKTIYEFLKNLNHEVQKWLNLFPHDHYALYVIDILHEIQVRWKSLTKMWFKKNINKYDTSKIPDIVDNVRFDLIHHHSYLGSGLDKAFEIYNLIEPLANFISQAEYGITPEEKVKIGVNIVGKLLRKLIHDVTYYRDEEERSKKNAKGSTAIKNAYHISYMHSRSVARSEDPKQYYSHSASKLTEHGSETTDRDSQKPFSVCKDDAKRNLLESFPFTKLGNGDKKIGKDKKSSGDAELYNGIRTDKATSPINNNSDASDALSVKSSTFSNASILDAKRTTKNTFLHNHLISPLKNEERKARHCISISSNLCSEYKINNNNKEKLNRNIKSDPIENGNNMDNHLANNYVIKIGEDKSQNGDKNRTTESNVNTDKKDNFENQDKSYTSIYSNKNSMNSNSNIVNTSPRKNYNISASNSNNYGINSSLYKFGSNYISGEDTDASSYINNYSYNNYTKDDLPNKFLNKKEAVVINSSDLWAHQNKYRKENSEKQKIKKIKNHKEVEPIEKRGDNVTGNANGDSNSDVILDKHGSDVGKTEANNAAVESSKENVTNSETNNSNKNIQTKESNTKVSDSEVGKGVCASANKNENENQDRCISKQETKNSSDQTSQNNTLVKENKNIVDETSVNKSEKDETKNGDCKEVYKKIDVKVEENDEQNNVTKDQENEIEKNDQLEDGEQDEHDEGEVHDDGEDIIRLKETDARRLGIRSPWRMVRSRYYVTSASHMMSLLNILIHSKNADSSISQNIIDNDSIKSIGDVTDLHYLSHLVFRVWERKHLKRNDSNRFRIEILFSSGAKDGFGQNYELIEKDAKAQQQKYERHINRYLDESKKELEKNENKQNDLSGSRNEENQNVNNSSIIEEENNKKLSEGLNNVTELKKDGKGEQFTSNMVEKEGNKKYTFDSIPNILSHPLNMPSTNYKEKQESQSSVNTTIPNPMESKVLGNLNKNLDSKNPNVLTSTTKKTSESVTSKDACTSNTKEALGKNIHSFSNIWKNKETIISSLKEFRFENNLKINNEFYRKEFSYSFECFRDKINKYNNRTRKYMVRSISSDLRKNMYNNKDILKLNFDKKEKEDVTKDNLLTYENECVQIRSHEKVRKTYRSFSYRSNASLHPDLKDIDTNINSKIKTNINNINSITPNENKNNVNFENNLDNNKDEEEKKKNVFSHVFQHFNENKKNSTCNLKFFYKTYMPDYEKIIENDKKSETFDVPPYCELAPLIVLTKNCQLSTFENILTQIVNKYSKTSKSKDKLKSQKNEKTEKK